MAWAPSPPASGQAALHLAIVTLMGRGGHIVASASLYGGSHNLLHYTLPRFGIETTFVPARDLDAWARAIRPETRLLFGESVGNPSVDVLDVPAVSKLAQQHKIPLLVDATVTTPALGRPFEQGAHLVVHSATKFLSGHGVVIGGVLVDGGRMDWVGSGKFPTLTEPYDGFHGMNFAEESTTSAFLPARAPRRPAGFRRVHGAHDRVPDPAGTRRRCRFACSATSPTRAAWSSSSRSRRKSSACTTRTRRTIPTTSSPRASIRAVAARSSLSS
jgi:hypothetical protein